jgi:hypothetical protein
MDDFEQDWADVTGGDYTMDEIAAGDDITSYDGFNGYDDSWFWDSIGIDPGSISTGGASPSNDEILKQIGYEEPGVVTSISNFLSKAGPSALAFLKNQFTDPKTGDVNWRNVAAAAGGIYGAYRSQQAPEKTGYQGGIPKYEAVREQVPETYDATRRPGSAAQKYFTDTKYVAPADAATARTAAKEEAAGLAAINKANPARQERPVLQAGAEKKVVAEKEIKPASSVIEQLPVPKYASGGIAEMARGQYISGNTDGMADKIPARIGGVQEARLSDGEFVVPADVVGHLGNGNSEAGAQRLYAMMDKIRKARTGTTKQGKQINPDKFLA